MRVITWNCNMAFRRKAGLILKYKPDILIIPECEHIDKFNFDGQNIKIVDRLWMGKNRNKGLGIFSFNGYRLSPIERYNDQISLVVPVTISGGPFDFNLFAIWANNPLDPDGQYIEQVWKAIDHYKERISSNKTMLIGDFNSNSVWDRKNRLSNHSNLVTLLAEKGIYSCYHLWHRQTHGQEKDPTFYLYRHQEKSYHLDYCFVSSDLSANLKDVKIGNHKTWCKYSDHVPLIVNFEY